MTDADEPKPADQHRSVSRVIEAARGQGLAIEVHRFPQGTRTAADAARAIGCSVAQIVKSLVFIAGEQPILALVSGADRADPELLSAALGAAGVRSPSPIRRATAEEARAATGFSIGGIPPLGHEHDLPILIDLELLRHEIVWAAAGLPDAVFAVDPAQLVRASGARVEAVATADPSGG